MQLEGIARELKLIPNSDINNPSLGKTSNSNFGDMLKEAITDVNSLQIQANKAVEQMISGEATSIHDVMIAAEKARTSFDLLMEVRNKTLDMYRELMRMQI